MRKTTGNNGTSAARVFSDRSIIDKTVLPHNFQQMSGISGVGSGVCQQSQRDFFIVIRRFPGDNNLASAGKNSAVIIENAQFKIKTFACICFIRRPEPAFIAVSAARTLDFKSIRPRRCRVNDIVKINIAFNTGGSINHFRQHHFKTRRRHTLFDTLCPASCKKQDSGKHKNQTFFHKRVLSVNIGTYYPFLFLNLFSQPAINCISDLIAALF